MNPESYGKAMKAGIFNSLRSSLVAAVTVVALCSYGAQAQTVTNIYSFLAASESAFPQGAALAQGRDGALYATAPGQGNGAFFRVQSDGRFKELFDFSPATGQSPAGGVTLARDGNFYGLAPGGGSNGLGVLFRITSGGTETVLHSFAGGADGTNPFWLPVQGVDGNFYGFTDASLYTYTSAGQYLVLNPLSLYQFPKGPPAQSSTGRLYAPTYKGGKSNCGAELKLTTAGALLNAPAFNCQNGDGAQTPTLLASDGFAYGTTLMGGNGAGNIYRVSLTTGVITNLYSFPADLSQGVNPIGAMVEATDGNLYGVTGGSADANLCGSVWSITKAGLFTLLHTMVSSEGCYLAGGIMQHTNGELYFLAEMGGAHRAGSVLSLDMGLGPFIALQKYQGKAGSTLQILGQGFTGTSSVAINGVAATSFTVVSDTYMTAVVPTGATTGNVVVTTPTGALTSNKPFTVNP